VAHVYLYLRRGWQWGCPVCAFRCECSLERASEEGARHQVQSAAMAHMQEQHPPNVMVRTGDLYELIPFHGQSFYVE
jgi:hypothetical protein